MTKKDLLENKFFECIPDNAILTVRLGANILVPISADDITFCQDHKQKNFLVISIPEYVEQNFEVEW